MSYGNTIAVHPLDPNHVICGGVDLHATTDGGTTWRVASRWKPSEARTKYAHADHHHWSCPSAPGRLYTANDGGMDLSPDGGAWTNRSNGLAVTMFYDADVAQSDGACSAAGRRTTARWSPRPAARRVLRAPGRRRRLDSLRSERGRAYLRIVSIWRHDRFRNGTTREVSPPFKPEESDGIWMVYITIDPNVSETVYTANQRVYRTMNDGLSWEALSAVLDGSPISAIEVAPGGLDPHLRWHGEWRFFPQPRPRRTWSANLASMLPGVMITRIETVLRTPQMSTLLSQTSETPTSSARRTAGQIGMTSTTVVCPTCLIMRWSFDPTAEAALRRGDAGVFVTHDTARVGRMPPRICPT